LNDLNPSENLAEAAWISANLLNPVSLGSCALFGKKDLLFVESVFIISTFRIGRSEREADRIKRDGGIVSGGSLLTGESILKSQRGKKRLDIPGI